MANIAHIRNVSNVWTFVRSYPLDEFGKAKGRISDINGKTLAEMPAAGQDFGDDKVVEVTEILNDTSTGPDTVTTVDRVVTSSSVTVTTTIVDKTAQQIDDEKTTAAQNRLNDAYGKLHLMEFAGIYWLINDVRTRHGQGTITVDQFLQNLDTFASQFDVAKFRDRIKDMIT